MKILFLFRDSYESNYILTQLERRKLVQRVVFEKGTTVNKRKIKRILKKAGFLGFPLAVLNLLSLFAYYFFIEKSIKNKLGECIFPKNKNTLVVNDANDELCIRYIQGLKPDVVFIFGTALLSKDFLQSVHATIINIHTGIIPYYRNVHSDFWAYCNKDYKNIGVSLFYVDTGIDTGDLAIQKRIEFDAKDTLVDIKTKILTMIPDLIELAIKKYGKNNLPRVRQKFIKNSFYTTPGFLDLIRCKYFRSNTKLIAKKEKQG